MKKTTLFLLSILFLLSLGSTVLVTYAVNGDEEAEEIDFACAKAVEEVASKELDDYITFLNEYFLSEDPSSEQVENAMERYRYYKDAVNGVFEEQVLVQGQVTFEKAFSEFAYCQNIRDQFLDAAQPIIQAQILQSSNSKRTFKIIDGMKELNEDMDTLNNDFQLTFPRIFEKMDNAFPCYVKECITQ